MSFVIKNVSKSSGRLGKWILRRDGSKTFDTPMILQTTKSGSIPWISADVMDYVTKEQQVLQFTLSTMHAMAECLPNYPPGISAYVGYPEFPNVLLLRDPCVLTPSGGNDRDTLPMYTRHGKEALTMEKYMEMVANLSPDVYQGPCDTDTNDESSKKRVQKSVDRTERFMEYCYENHSKLERLANATLLAPIVGGYNTFARSQSVKHARQHDGSHGGYILEGFHTNGLTATALDASKLLPVVEHSIRELESSKIRIMPGAYSPLMVVELIRLGIDVFDTSYAYCAALNYKALTFSFDIDKDKSVEHKPFLDVTDSSIEMEFTPFLNDCSCLACTKHTRAYVHHLYNTKELLGHILLMIHNLHHYMAFFEAIRVAIAEDKLPELVNHLKTQNGTTTVDYEIVKNEKVVGNADISKGLGISAEQ